MKSVKFDDQAFGKGVVLLHTHYYTIPFYAEDVKKNYKEFERMLTCLNIWLMEREMEEGGGWDRLAAEGKI